MTFLRTLSDGWSLIEDEGSNGGEEGREGGCGVAPHTPYKSLPLQFLPAPRWDGRFSPLSDSPSPAAAPCCHQLSLSPLLSYNIKSTSTAYRVSLIGIDTELISLCCSDCIMELMKLVTIEIVEVLQRVTTLL